jgi:hypothetical protein
MLEKELVLRIQVGADGTPSQDKWFGLAENLKKRKKSRDDSRLSRLGSPRHALIELCWG